MTKQELIERLQELQRTSLIDPELAHITADNLLVEFINDKDIENEFLKIKRKYS